MRSNSLALLTVLVLAAAPAGASAPLKAAWPLQLKGLLRARWIAEPKLFSAAVDSVAQNLGRSRRADQDFLEALAPHMDKAELEILRRTLESSPAGVGEASLAKVHDAALAVFNAVNQRASRLVAASQRGYEDSDDEQYRELLQDARVAQELLSTRRYFLFDDGEHGLRRRLQQAHRLLEKNAKQAAERRSRELMRKLRARGRLLSEARGEGGEIAGQEPKPRPSGLASSSRKKGGASEEAATENRPWTPAKGGLAEIENAALGMAAAGIPGAESLLGGENPYAAASRRLDHAQLHLLIDLALGELLRSAPRIAKEPEARMRFERLSEVAEVLYWASREKGLHPLFAMIRLRQDQFETTLAALERELGSEALSGVVGDVTPLLRKAGYGDSHYSPMAMQDPVFGDQAYDRELDKALRLEGLASRDEALLAEVYLKARDFDLKMGLEAFLGARVKSPAERLAVLERWHRGCSAIFLATYPQAGPSRAALAERLFQLGWVPLLSQLESFFSSPAGKPEALPKLRGLRKGLQAHL